jgi:hypothetical protein
MELVVYSVPVAALIVGLVEMAKRSFRMSARWAAPLAVLLGVIFAAAAKLDQPTMGTWLQVVMLGLLTGLSAAGLYSGGKAMARE